MKYLFKFVLMFIILCGCSDAIESKIPSFEGLKDGQLLWQSTTLFSSIDSNGVLTITGTDGFGELVIKLPSATIGVYSLGESSDQTATYSEDNTVFSTLNNGAGSIVYISDGQVSLTSVDANRFSGSFFFNAYTSDGSVGVNFSEGAFYKVPLAQ
jgi:hypothetical protein